MTTQASAGPRGLWYHGWNIVMVVVLSQIAANGLALNSMSLFLQDWSRDLHAPISALLLATLPFAIAISFSSPFIGMFADKCPARLLIAVGLIGIVIFCLLMSFTNATWQIWVLYGTFFPISLGLCGLATVNAVVSRWFVRRIGVALGITALGSALGGVILPPIIAEVMPAIGWRSVWRGAAFVIAVVVLPLVLWIVRDRPAERDGLHYIGGATHAHGAQSAEDLRSTDILKRRNFWLLVLCYTPVLGLNGAVQQNIAPIAGSHGFDQSTAGMLLAVFSVSQMFAILLLGLASDRFGNRLPLASLSVTIMAGAAFLAFGDSLPSLVAGSALVGFTGGIWTLMPAAVAAEFGAGGVGRAFGMLMFFLPISALASALLAKVQESTGSYAPALMGLGAICLMGGAAILFMRERHRGHPTPAEKAAALEETVIPLA
ncbi:MAG TPA: MFS transporter [Allosphingosinicella sp.]|nr:MFS transporter [Allosphingosinicella sp.]